jgi:preprotein translocase subunit SecD
MAVDANVLIFGDSREVRNGKTPKMAVEQATARHS